MASYTLSISDNTRDESPVFSGLSLLAEDKSLVFLVRSGDCDCGEGVGDVLRVVGGSSPMPLRVVGGFRELLLLLAFVGVTSEMLIVVREVEVRFDMYGNVVVRCTCTGVRFCDGVWVERGGADVSTELITS
jgi:hypothetical protein